MGACEHATVAASVCGAAAASRLAPRRIPGPEDPEAAGPGERLAGRLSGWVESRGALDGPAAERALLPAILCAASAGARAGSPRSSAFTTSEVTPSLLALARLAHLLLPVRAVVDGEAGGEGRVAVAPAP